MYGLIFFEPSNDHEKKLKKHFYCSLCHSLANNYGNLYRSFLSHDAVFLSMLTNAQMKNEENRLPVKCICNPKYETEPLNLKYSSAIAFMLGRSKLLDDYYEGASRLSSIKMALLNRGHHRSKSVLCELGFPSSIFDEQVKRQHILERKPESVNINDLCAPTERIVSTVFEYSAAIAGIEENRGTLHQIGLDIGGLIYLLDGYTDIYLDLHENKFNPFLSCGVIKPILTRRNLTKIHRISEKIAMERLKRIKRNSLKLKLHRYGSTIRRILINDLEKRVRLFLDHGISQPRKTDMKSLIFPSLSLLSFRIAQSDDCCEACCDIDCGSICEETCVQQVTQHVTTNAAVGAAVAVGGGLAAAAANNVINNLRSREPPEEDREDREREEDESEKDYYLSLTVTPKSTLKGDGKDSCRILAEIIASDGSRPPGRYIFSSSSASAGILTQRVSEATFVSNMIIESKSVTIRCVGVVALPRGGTKEAENSVTIDIIGAEPTLTLSAERYELVGDGVLSSKITAECSLFNEIVDVEVGFHTTDKGSLSPTKVRSPGEPTTFTPQYTDQDTSATILANATIHHSSAGSFLVEESVTIKIKSAALSLKATPSEIDGDEISRSLIEVEPRDRAHLSIGLRSEPQDYGKLTDKKPPSNYIANLTERDREVSIIATIQTPQAQVKRREIETRISIIGAAPRLRLKASKPRVNGDGKSQLRIDCETFLFGEKASEDRLQQLGAKIEWKEENPRNPAKPLGKFVVDRLTYAEFVPHLAWEDTETTVKVKLTLISKETGERIEEESEPLTIRINGASPELRLKPDKGSVPGVDDRKYEVEVEAQLYLFGEKRSFPEDVEVEFELLDTDLGYRESREPTVAVFWPKFVARDKDGGEPSQGARMEGRADIEASKLFPHLAEELDETIHVKGETEIRVEGCLVKIMELTPEEPPKEKEGKLFDLKASVTTQNFEGVPEIQVRYTFEPETKDPSRTSYKQASTDEKGVSEVGYTQADLKKFGGGVLVITAEIFGARNTRDWDQLKSTLGTPIESIDLVLTVNPPQLPGAERTTTIDPVESIIEARLTSASGDVEHAEKSVTFTPLDEDLGEWEEHPPMSIKFKPFFLAYDRERNLIKHDTSVRCEISLTSEELSKISPLMRTPTAKGIGVQAYKGALPMGRIIEGAEVPEPTREAVQLEKTEKVTIIGCKVKIVEPDDETQYLVKDGELFKVKAKVTSSSTLSLDSSDEAHLIPNIPVEFTFLYKTEKSSKEWKEENLITDEDGIVECPFQLPDGKDSEKGEVKIRAEIKGARNTKDYDEITVNVISSIELTITARSVRIFGEKPEITSDNQKFETRRKIEVKVD